MHGTFLSFTCAHWEGLNERHVGRATSHGASADILLIRRAEILDGERYGFEVAG